MDIHTLTQGDAAWHAHRATHLNASDAPAMLGVSPYKTRQQLLHEMHTGVPEEHSDTKLALFARGHASEALARPLAEEIIGEELSPMVGSEGRLSASYDGLTLIGDVAFEHKSLNQELRNVMQPGCKGTDLPMHHQVQMEQQCMVAGCGKVLFMASEWTDDGKLVEERHCWYKSSKELAAKIAAGWELFEADLKTYVPAEVVVPATPVALLGLPGVSIRVEGKITLSTANLDDFGIRLKEFIAKVPTQPSTDAEFATCKNAVKELEKAEVALRAAEDSALAQFAELDMMRRTVDLHFNTSRTFRLSTEKMVTAREQAIRAETIQAHQKELDEFVAGLNKRLGAAWVPRTVGGFVEAIKGKRNVDSVRAAAAQELADQKLRLQAVAAQLFDNLAALKVGEDDWMFLFADFAALGQKPTEDFKAIADARIAAHKDALEKKRLQEEERKKREAEEAEARRLASEKAAAVVVPAPVPGPAAAAAPAQADLLRFPPPPVPAALPASMRAPADLPPRAAEQPTLKLGDICDRLGFIMNAEFVTKTLGVPRRNTDGRAVLFFPSDFNQICIALANHIESVQVGF